MTNKTNGGEGMPSESALPDLGRRLCAARLRRGLSQGTVARLSGIGPSYLSRIENGRVQPSFRTVIRVQRALKADFEELAGPTGRTRRNGSCPVSRHGHCLLDMIRAEMGESGSAIESYTPRQVRLLRRLAAWLQTAPPDRLRAMEILLEDLRPAGRSS